MKQVGSFWLNDSKGDTSDRCLWEMSGGVARRFYSAYKSLLTPKVAYVLLFAIVSFATTNTVLLYIPISYL